MSEVKQYPFNLSNAFFISLNFKRMANIPEPLEINIEAQTRLVLEKYPDRFQANLRIISPEEDRPLHFSIEIVGLFDYIGDNPDEDKSLILPFLADRGLHVLWSLTSQMVRLITGQMGMSPISTSMPLSFDLQELESKLKPEE